MMTRTSSTSLERTAVSLAGTTCAAIDSCDSKTNRSQTSCRSRHPNSSSPLRSMIEIFSAESIKRLSSGRPGWCSESVHAPIGKRMEFHFQGSVHLLAMYHDGSRRDGETSIDGRAHSTIRNFANKLTFVPAGHSYRERLETAAFTRLTFLYLQPAHLQSDGRTSYAPRLHFEDPIVWDTAAKLKNAIEHGRPETAPYLAALSNVLAFELSCPDQAAMHEIAEVSPAGRSAPLPVTLKTTSATKFALAPSRNSPGSTDIISVGRLSDLSGFHRISTMFKGVLNKHECCWRICRFR
jgi:AraC family transcriptional regulator